MFRVVSLINASYKDKARLQNSVTSNTVKDFADLVVYLSSLGLLLERIIDAKLLRTILNTNPETLLRDAREAYIMFHDYTYGDVVFKIYCIVRSNELKGTVKVRTSQTFVMNRERLARGFSNKYLNSCLVDRDEIDIPEVLVNSIEFYHKPHIPASDPKNDPKIYKLMRLYDP